MEVENTFLQLLSRNWLHSWFFSTTAAVWTSLNPRLAVNCAPLCGTSFVKYSAANVKRPSSCLFVLFHSTPSTAAAAAAARSCLNVWSCVSLWMAPSCFRKTPSNRGWVSDELRPHAHPTPFAGPDVHAQINTLVPLFLHNDFTHPWPCSNEVWRFCDATGKLTRWTLLSVSVYSFQPGHSCFRWLHSMVYIYIRRK